MTPHRRLSVATADQSCTDDQVPDLGAVRDADVAGLRSYNPGMGSMFKDLFASSDGAPFEPAGSAPRLGISQAYLTIAPGPRGGKGDVYCSTDGGVRWATIDLP